MFNNIAIGPITIHMYGVMIAAGFLAALLMTLRRGKLYLLPHEKAGVYAVF